MQKYILCTLYYCNEINVLCYYWSILLRKSHQTLYAKVIIYSALGGILPFYHLQKMNNYAFPAVIFIAI